MVWQLSDKRSVNTEMQKQPEVRAGLDVPEVAEDAASSSLRRSPSIAMEATESSLVAWNKDVESMLDHTNPEAVEVKEEASSVSDDVTDASQALEPKEDFTGLPT